MDEPGQQSRHAVPRVAAGGDEHATTVVVHIAIPRGTLRTWRIHADATLHVQGARIWVTRICSPYDFWVQPHGELRLRRGERIWISVDGDCTAHVSLTSPITQTNRMWSKWTGWLADIAFDLFTPRPR
jgi:hypothetical protein